MPVSENRQQSQMHCGAYFFFLNKGPVSPFLPPLSPSVAGSIPPSPAHGLVATGPGAGSRFGHLRMQHFISFFGQNTYNSAIRHVINQDVMKAVLCHILKTSKIFFDFGLFMLTQEIYSHISRRYPRTLVLQRN